MRYLVLHDVDAIQKYVLATKWLREIRGASALIDELNRRESLRRAIAHRGEPIYFGGGGAATDFADEREANAFCNAVSDLYVQETKTAHSTGVVVPYDENADQTAPAGLRSRLQEGHRLLRSKKVSLKRKTQLLTSPFFKRCQSCGIYPVSTHSENVLEPNAQFFCESCSIKREKGRNWSEIHRKIQETMRRDHDIEIELPETLEDIGIESKPRGYIGVIYADGNRMGDHFQKIKGKLTLKEFSNAVDKAARETICAIIVRRYETQLRSRSNQDEATILPVIVPLCGGDDLIVIAPAHHALEIAVEYLREFQGRVKKEMSDEVKAELGTDEISACAGVAIAKETAPISELFELTQELCKIAKRRSYDIHLQEQRETACLDFQVVTTPSWGGVEETRSEQLTIRDRRLTYRPYTGDEAERLIRAAQELKAHRFPQSKLIDLYRSLWQGKHLAQLNYLTLFVRALPEQKQVLDRIAAEYLDTPNPPWKKVGPEDVTCYGDLVELYPFVEG